MFGVWRNGQYRRSQYAVDIDSQRSRELGGPMQIRTLHHFHQLRTFIMVDDSYPSGGRGGVRQPSCNWKEEGRLWSMQVL